jgi:hypothetical protein
MMLPFSEWRPDWNDTNGSHTQRLRNAVPRADGYGPWFGLETFTQSLPAACRGGFLAQMPDGTVRIFAGTEDRLYLLNNTTLAWTDVSAGGTAYAPLAGDANWVFAQFNDSVIATQRNDDMQEFELGTDTQFADLAGSPPRAGWISTVGRFLVAADLAANPLRVQWSGLNEIDNWTAGTNSSDFQDLPDNGRARCVVEVAGDVGLILQDGGARRMIFSPGSEYVFQIDRLQNVPGVLAPYSVVVSTGGAYYLSTAGFVLVSADGARVPIGEERVDRTFLGLIPGPPILQSLTYDDGNPQLVVGASDPRRNIIVFGYKASGSDLAIDRALIYHTTLKRWAPIEIDVQYLLSVARPGLTLEGLDAIAPGAMAVTGAADNGSGLIRIQVASTATLTTGDWKTLSAVGGVSNANGTFQITVIDGTHFDLDGSTFAGSYTSGGVVGGSVDDIPFSFDEISTADLPALAAISTSGALGFFSGDALEADLMTPEQSIDGWRINVNGLRPFTDAPSVFGSTVTRDTFNGSPVDGDESEMDEDGYCPLLDEARFARARIRIPAATEWSYATGVEADTSRAGRL